MTPEYIRSLADLADPDQLWRLSGFDQLGLSPEKRQQLDTGVALRRHAAHVEELRMLVGTGRSLLLTQIEPNWTARKTIPTPPDHARLVPRK